MIKGLIEKIYIKIGFNVKVAETLILHLFANDELIREQESDEFEMWCIVNKLTLIREDKITSPTLNDYVIKNGETPFMVYIKDKYLNKKN